MSVMFQESNPWDAELSIYDSYCIYALLILKYHLFKHIMCYDVMYNIYVMSYNIQHITYNVYDVMISSFIWFLYPK